MFHLGFRSRGAHWGDGEGGSWPGLPAAGACLLSRPVVLCRACLPLPPCRHCCRYPCHPHSPQPAVDWAVAACLCAAAGVANRPSPDTWGSRVGVCGGVMCVAEAVCASCLGGGEVREVALLTGGDGRRGRRCWLQASAGEVQSLGARPGGCLLGGAGTMGTLWRALTGWPVWRRPPFGRAVLTVACGQSPTPLVVNTGGAPHVLAWARASACMVGTVGTREHGNPFFFVVQYPYLLPRPNGLRILLVSTARLSLRWLPFLSKRLGNPPDPVPPVHRPTLPAQQLASSSSHALPLPPTRQPDPLSPRLPHEWRVHTNLTDHEPYTITPAAVRTATVTAYVRPLVAPSHGRASPATPGPSR